MVHACTEPGHSLAGWQVCDWSDLCHGHGIIFSASLFYPPTIDMARIRRCPTCKVLFPTIDAVNYHYQRTSHIPLPYKCESESCERVYKKSSLLLKVGFQLSVLIGLLISWAHTLWSIPNRSIPTCLFPNFPITVNLATGYLTLTHPAYLT